MKKLLKLGIIIIGINAYSQAGSLDTGFGTGGKVVTSINSGADKAYGVALQSDGKIVVAGYSYSSIYGNDFACARYNTNGSLDITFGNNGIKTYDLQVGSDDKAYSVDIQLDGKIVLAGYSDNGSDKAGAVIRLNTDGTLDTSFSSDGKVFTNFTYLGTLPRADEFKVVKVHQLTGNIVVGGTSYDGPESKGIFARYNSTGALDTTFGNGGILIDLPYPESNSNGFTFVIEDLKLKSNGKITAVGWSDVPGSGSLAYSRQYVCRLNSNGTLDTTFSSDGYASNSFTTSDNKTYSLILKPDDSLLFSGSSYYSATDYQSYFGSVSSSGTVSVQGSISFAANTIDMCYGMGLDSTGKIIIAGSVINSTANTSNFSLARINSNYTIDTTFGSSGIVMTSFGANTFSESYDMAIQSDDKIILVGYSGNDFAIARYNGNTLSNNEFGLNKQITLYPNPVKNKLNIDLQYNQSSSDAFKICDINGRVILGGNLTNGLNQINVENLSNGLYIFNAENINQKFIKE